MHAAILHAPGDEPVAQSVIARIAPAECFAAELRGDAGVTLGDQLALFAIWSARAEAAGLSQALSRIASRAAGRCVVVRADGTPLPPLPTSARILTTGEAAPAFRAAFDMALGRITPVSTRPAAASASGGWASGAGIGLAIYAGMFVAAGAWRSEEVNEAVANGTAVPLAGALHSFQVASADALTGAIQIAQAPSTPRAAFVEPQRVVLTATLDSTTVPIVAADVADSTPLATAPAEAEVPALRLHTVAPEIVVAASFAPEPAPELAALDLVDTF